MQDHYPPTDDRERFAAQYLSARSRAARRVEQRALGSADGSNGYTTPAEALAIIEHLRSSAPRSCLEVGAGRGWPGILVARQLESRLVGSDIPRDALVEARTEMRARGVPGDVVQSDGRWLPFDDNSFEAVIHSDVFC